MSSTAAAVLAQIPKHRTPRVHTTPIPVTAAAISLRTVPAVLAGNAPSFQVIDVRGQHVATVAWREFASSYGWQCRLAGDRRTLRNTFGRVDDALILQGRFEPNAARAAVLANAEAMDESL